MLFRNFFINDNTQVGIWQINESEADLRAMLSPDALADQRLQNMKSTSRRLEYLAVRCLLKEMTGAEQHILYNDRRPYLTNNTSLSIAHTQGWAAVALSATPIGIDIEHCSDRALHLAERFMTPSELADNLQLTDDPLLQRNHATLIWSAKEAIFKVHADGCVDFLHHIATNPFEMEGMGELTGFDTCTSSRRDYLVRFMQHSSFILTLAEARP